MSRGLGLFDRQHGGVDDIVHENEVAAFRAILEDV